MRLRRALASRYTVERELGVGGMGAVFLAREEALQRPVAIKVLHPELATARGAERFLREAKILARIRHPNVVPVHLADQADGLFYYVMEYVEGESLFERLRRGRLSLAEAVELGQGLLAALEATHGQGIVHRDIKPANIFLGKGQVRLGDFGIARPTQEDGSPISSSSEPIGTEGYMSPEQTTGGDATALSDLYVVGIVLYQALTGRRWKVVQDPGRADWTGVPRAVRRVLRRALAFAARNRWQEAGAFRRALVEAGRRKERILAVGAFGVLGLVFLGKLLLDWLLGGTSKTSRQVGEADLAVVPFTSGESPSQFGRLLAQHTAQQLELFPQWKLTPTGYSFEWWDTVAPGGRRVGAASALRSDYLVAGELLSTSSPAVEISIYDSTGALSQRLRIPGDSANPLTWSRAAADSIVAKVYPQWLGRYRDLAGRQTHDLAAYRLFFRGDSAFQRDAWVEADRYYQAALDRDSTFLLAAWRLSVLRMWRRVPFELDLQQLYDRHRDQLAELYRLLIEAQLTPDIRSRLALYDSAVRLFPRDGYAALLYANEAFTRGPLVGVPLDSALALLREAARKDPYFDQAPALDHITWGQIRLGRKREAWESLRARLGIEARSKEIEDVNVAALLPLAYHERFNPRVGALLRWWSFRDPDRKTIEQLSKVARMALTFDLPGAQDELAQIVLGKGSEGTASRASAHEARGLALMALGRFTEAYRSFDSAAAFFGSAEAALQASEWRVVPAALGLPLDSLQHPRAFGRLVRVALEDTASVRAVRAAFDLALDAFRNGDAAAAAGWRRRVERAASQNNETAVRFLALLQAMESAQRGDLKAALELSAPLLAYDSTGIIGGPFARAVARLNRGRWWQRMGRLPEADREWLWYENSDLVGWPGREAQAGEVDAVMGVYARLLRGELALELGDRTLGCAYLQRVAELWSQADPSMRSLRGAADSLSRSCRR